MRVFQAIVLVAGLLICASAEAQTMRLSWGTCDPQVADTSFDGPGAYKLVLSGFAIADSIVGHDCTITISGDIQDAWRFDDGGCQNGAITMGNTALNKSCPALRGASPLEIKQFAFDPGSQTASLRLSVAFDSLATDPNKRYTMWQITFDHSNSVSGVDEDPSTCDGAGPPHRLNFDVSGQLLTISGVFRTLLMAEGDQRATWNGGSGQEEYSGSAKAVFKE